jgi:predicted nucleic acid-binding protein
MTSKFVLDSFAWMCYFNGEDIGNKVKEMLGKVENGEFTLFTPVLVLAEISDKLHRDGRDARAAFNFIRTNSIIIQIDDELAFNAGIVKSELRKFSSNVSLPDAVHFEAARSIKAIFVTGDPDFKNIKGVMFLK